VKLPTLIVTDKMKLSRTLKAEISKLTNLGYLEITFNNDVMVPNYLQAFNQMILELSVHQ
jgi:hypothetical protein